MFRAGDNMFRECRFYQVIQCRRWNHNEVHLTAFRKQANIRKT